MLATKSGVLGTKVKLYLNWLCYFILKSIVHIQIGGLEECKVVLKVTWVCKSYKYNWKD